MTPAQVEEYRTRGFVLVSGLIPPDELQRLTEHADVYVRPEDDKTWGGQWRDRYGELGRDFVLWSRHGIHQESEAWAQFGAAHPVRDAATQLLGEQAHLHQTTAVYKPAETGQAFPLHQDALYYGTHCRNYVIAVVHLDQTHPANGPLRFWPGVHQGTIRHQGTGGKTELDPVEYPVAQTVEVCGAPGDVVLFSIYTPHCSFPNTTNRVRRTVRLGYCTES